jgi:superfamily II DNA or RNA helicase
MSKFVLDGYQYRALQGLRVRLFDEGLRDLALVSGTGSGKTVMVTSFLAELLHPKREFRCAVVLCHREDIEANWHRKDDPKLEIVYPPGTEVRPLVMKSLTVREEESRTHELGEFLHSPRPEVPVMVTSYQTFARLVDAGRLPSNMSDVLICGDEGHHAALFTDGTEEALQASPAWKRSRAEARRRGAGWLTVTATDFRSDEDLVVDPSGVVRVSTSELIEAGRRPKVTRVRTQSLKALASWRESTANGDQGEMSSTPCLAVDEDDAMVMAKAWQRDGFPRAIFRVQTANVCAVPGNKDTTQPAQIIRALKAVNPELRDDEILDATGSAAERRRHIRDVLHREHEAKSPSDEDPDILRFDLDKSKIKIVVAVQRFTEGTDWPFCSHIYALGLPASLVFILQLLGRAQRAKRDILNYENRYPSYVDVSTCTFFLPKITDVEGHQKDLGELSTLIGIIQEDYELGHKLGGLARHLREEIRKATGSRVPPWQRLLEGLTSLRLQTSLGLTEYIKNEEIQLELRTGHPPSTSELTQHIVAEAERREGNAVETFQKVLLVLLDLESRADAPENLSKLMEGLARDLVRRAQEDKPKSSRSNGKKSQDSLERLAVEALPLLQEIARELGPAAVSFAERYLRFAVNIDPEFLKRIRQRTVRLTRHAVDDIVGPIYAHTSVVRGLGRFNCPEDIGVLMRPPLPAGVYMRDDLIKGILNGAIEGLPPDARSRSGFESHYKIYLGS